jgi:hypothetical protein
VNQLIMRLPTEQRDGDGVRVDEALEQAGAIVLRELPRQTDAWVDLLVEHTSAPEAVRGLVVTPVFDEIEDPGGGSGKVLSFAEWREWAPAEVESGE